MFGSGAIDAMISSIRNNRALISSSKGIYSEKYRKLRKEYKQKTRKIDSGKLLTASEKAKIRLDIRRDHTQQNVKKLFFTLMITVIVLLLIAHIIPSAVQSTLEKTYQEERAEKENKFYRAFYKGQEAVHHRNYHSAANLFQEALTFRPANIKAEHWLAKTYFYWSSKDEYMYEKAKHLVDSLAVKHPEKRNFQALKEHFPPPQ